MVVPQLKQELEALASAKTLFSEYGIAVLCPSKNILDLLNDKSRLYNRLESEGFAVPAISKLDKFDSFVSTMLKLGYPSKKIKVEPISKRLNSDFRIVDDSVDAYSSLFPNLQNPLISYTQLSKLLSADNFPELLLSVCIDGALQSQIGYYEKGTCKTNTYEDPEPLNMILMQLSSSIADVLNLNGSYQLDFVQTEAGFYFTDLKWMMEEEYLLVSIKNELAQLD
ncbi:carbamoyl phosphate synthase-like protein [compost metagenome]